MSPTKWMERFAAISAQKWVQHLPWGTRVASQSCTFFCHFLPPVRGATKNRQLSEARAKKRRLQEVQSHDFLRGKGGTSSSPLVLAWVRAAQQATWGLSRWPTCIRCQLATRGTGWRQGYVVTSWRRKVNKKKLIALSYILFFKGLSRDVVMVDAEFRRISFLAPFQKYLHERKLISWKKSLTLIKKLMLPLQTGRLTQRRAKSQRDTAEGMCPKITTSRPSAARFSRQDLPCVWHLDQQRWTN